MKKIIYLLIFVFCISLTFAYTPQTYDSVNLVLNISYTPQIYNSVNLILGEPAITDSCSPTSPLTSNHVYQCSDYCNITSNVNAGGYNVSFNGTGTITITANITNSNKIHVNGENESSICLVRLINGGSIF
jgi:hypothetical protein